MHTFTHAQILREFDKDIEGDTTVYPQVWKRDNFQHEIHTSAEKLAIIHSAFKKLPTLATISGRIGAIRECLAGVVMCVHAASLVRNIHSPNPEQNS